uniref:Peptidase M61 n=1 Tax=Stylophora pistillata TaxID=50429 RepID=A0A2B4S0A2_STYPI
MVFKNISDETNHKQKHYQLKPPSVVNECFGAIIFGLTACGTLKHKSKKPSTLAKEAPIKAYVNVVKTDNDRVPVTVDPGKFKTSKVIYRLPRVVQGTYSVSDFGKYIEGFKAIDYKGGELPVKKIDTNSWEILNAQKLDKVVYLVNDTYDQEKQGGLNEDVPFSPAGTNIESDNYVLNLHGFVGYFDLLKKNAYKLTVTVPADFKVTTSLDLSRAPIQSADGLDYTYNASRYFDITDNPIFCGDIEVEKFSVGDMEIILSVYSPNKKHTAKKIKEGVEKMMRAQKNYLGAFNSTKRYGIFVYLSDMKSSSAKGFGALEHHKSTVVVLPEMMPAPALENAMKDVVSHEFFHIVSPLSVHSEDVHYFDYNKPTFSKHLWMYEGITEYFANLFQINQGLINEDDFYKRITTKIQRASDMDDEMSFTEMSENVLEKKYHDQYVNVYQKGALIGMCIDILLRESSNGKKGVLSLMKKLSEKYGKNKPFEDDKLIQEITAMNAAVGTFLNKNVVQGVPIDYNEYFQKVGLSYEKAKTKTGYIRSGNGVIVTFDAKLNGIKFTEGVNDNSFWKAAGAKAGDAIRVVNGEKIGKSNINQIVNAMEDWKEGEKVSIVLERDGKEVVINTVTKQPFYAKGMVLKPNENATAAQINLRNAWLKGE